MKLKDWFTGEYARGRNFGKEAVPEAATEFWNDTIQRGTIVMDAVKTVAVKQAKPFEDKPVSKIVESTLKKIDQSENKRDIGQATAEFYESIHDFWDSKNTRRSESIISRGKEEKRKMRKDIASYLDEKARDLERAQKAITTNDEAEHLDSAIILLASMKANISDDAASKRRLKMSMDRLLNGF